MSRTLRKVQNTFKKTLDVNFFESVELTGIVQNINDNIFTIKIADDKIIECQSNKPVTELKKNETVFVEGWFKADTKNVIRLYLQLKYYCVISEKEIFQKFLKDYDRLVKALTTKSKFQNIIKCLEQKPLPKMIYNVALIVMPGNETHAENFKISFQDKCLGKLYVYYLKNQAGAVEEALKFFNKYHCIDLICLLTDQISTNDIKLLSTITCVKYMLRRKEHPYIMSIIKTENSSKTDSSMILPLSAILSNGISKNIDTCTNTIHNIQFRFKDHIEKKLELGKNKLIEKIDKEKRKIMDLELELSNILGISLSSISSNTNVDKFEKVKSLLNKNLDQEMNNLLTIKNFITENIVEDERVQFYYPIIIQSEKNILVGKTTTNKDFDKIHKNVPNYTTTINDTFSNTLDNSSNNTSDNTF